jgi:hypothetical protein
MQVLLGRTFVDLEGKEINAEAGTSATLRGIVVNALLASFEDEKQLSGEEKLRRWELAQSIQHATDPVEIKSEDITLIKKLVGKAYTTIIVGQAWQMLEGK